MPVPKGPLIWGRIEVNKLDAKSLIDKLKTEGIEVRLNLLKDGRSIVSCKVEEKERICAVLKELKLQGHSFQSREERYESRLLKNVAYSFGPEAVKEEITERLKEMAMLYEEFEVEYYSTYFSAENRIQLPIYIVKTWCKDTMNMITGINRLCYAIPRWERLRKAEITQCFDCYGFGHSTMGNCFHAKMCKRCGEELVKDHDCGIQMIPDYDEQGNEQNRYLNYRCCNCKKTGHPPTWTGCPVYQRKLSQVRY